MRQRDAMHQLLTPSDTHHDHGRGFGPCGVHAVASIDHRRMHERARLRRTEDERARARGGTSDTYQSGLFGEEIVADHLTGQGWRLLGHRVRTRVGELDLVAQRDDLVIFAEVKTARPGRIAVEQAVSARQRHRIRRAAVAWMASHPASQRGVRRYRFDVFFVRRDEDGAVERIDHVTDAF